MPGRNSARADIYQLLGAIREHSRALPHASRDAIDDATTLIETLVKAYCPPDGGDIRFSGIPLTKADRKIINLLMSRRGQPVSKQAIYDGMYFARGADDLPDPKVVDVFICKLRKLLKLYKSPWRIDTVWGHGYQITAVSSPKLSTACEVLKALRA